MAFLDIKSAYDQVDRTLLWNHLRQRGTNLSLLRVICSLFDGCESRLLIRGNLSAPFDNNSGLMQGSLLSPSLYSAFINSLLDSLDTVSSGVDIGGHQFNALMYADDIVIMAKDPTIMQALLDTAHRHSYLYRYRFNTNKCEVIASEPTNFWLDGMSLRQVTTFKYLGIHFDINGINWKLQIDSTWNTAQRATGILKAAGCYPNGLSVDIALTLYKTFVRPIIEYGLQLIPLVKDVTHVSLIHSRCVRMLLSLGQGRSVLAAGLWAEMESMRARHSILRLRWWYQLSQKGATFAVFYGLIDNQRSP